MSRIDIYWRTGDRPLLRWHTTRFAHYISIHRLQINIARKAPTP